MCTLYYALAHNLCGTPAHARVEHTDSVTGPTVIIDMVPHVPLSDAADGCAATEP